MKINETFGPLSEQDVVDETRRMETEVLAQLKSEFQDFVTQTRERLRMVSESLVELEREYPVASPVVHQQVEAPPEEVESQPIVDAEPAPPEPAPPEPAPLQAERPESIAEPARPVGDDSESPVSDVDFWTEGASDPDPQPSMTEDASKDASFPSATDLDSDPTERLKAIKQRLARQIENS